MSYLAILPATTIQIDLKVRGLSIPNVPSFAPTLPSDERLGEEGK